MFEICRFQFKCQKNYEIFTPCKAQISPTIEDVLNLLRLGAFDILNIQISTLMSIIIFIKYFYLISIFIKFKYILSIFHFENNLV